VSKRFGRVAALDEASFSVEEGEIVALLGPNGAGKSTALCVLLGLRRADSGVARLFGGDPRRPASRRSVGVTPQDTTFPPTLRVREVIELVRAHFGRPLPVGTVVERFQLDSVVSRQLGGLSGGERRRVGVALAFAGDPRLVVLDEPTTGLDVQARRAVWDAIRSHVDGGGTILLTTHNLEEAETLARRVVVIEAGRIVADGPTAEIKAAAGLTVVRFRAGAGQAIEGAVRDGVFLRILTADAIETVERLLREGRTLTDLEVRPISLEEALEASR
jgi:ABC-2 type transport system ATP-binding protein